MKRLTQLSILLLALAAMAAPAFAGGWSVVTLDSLPNPIVAGEPFTIGFVVRQHGRTPMAELEPVIQLHQADAPETFVVLAEPEGAAGHYAATITFPGGGDWNWSINAFPEPQSMPRLTVLSAKTMPVTGPATSGLPLMVGLAGLIGAGAAFVVFLRGRGAWAAALILVGALVSALGFISAANRGPASVDIPPAYSQEQLGQRLFVAKGCVVCHTHDAARESWQGMAVDIGPNLTNFTAAPDYLAKWLDDPSAIKPETQMPTLGLSDDEIGALVAFINAP